MRPGIHDEWFIGGQGIPLAEFLSKPAAHWLG
jgi:hypothetical protein